ncbi:hypothetical protein DERF_009888 [Dermatophagoides farinae]|uniref:Uncharacterized protein n=1 Tax=Dermatophagoides farinae TaxID=6954 RepID=A0A922I032_DERFA|nr:hypothetical protein DERF_009888 [Dermatophagoides farinae]
MNERTMIEINQPTTERPPHIESTPLPPPPPPLHQPRLRNGESKPQGNTGTEEFRIKDTLPPPSKHGAYESLSVAYQEAMIPVC